MLKSLKEEAAYWHLKHFKFQSAADLRDSTALSSEESPSVNNNGMPNGTRASALQGFDELPDLSQLRLEDKSEESDVETAPVRVPVIMFAKNGRQVLRQSLLQFLYVFA
ncbi:unnamed protein product [Gongylonema pulchrum]|uniref:Uncharacterized protein n=1 Tax=Gongylonema pulchrum TaxID=637853 RepID=A0A183D6T2_9BILA|nr:unnamed protein product [Gongylonema pulchrum]